ncbi:hypothetical protein Tco_0627173 [Tanacetum coccineum]|uniref:Uncharacterized protein n=1 Tax=Tanacetum coccineum TaxID=301880 RepID=A0ABQ4WLP8_9ASTR
MIAKQLDNQLRWNVPKSNAIARQNSMYNLTLDEVKNQLGDLGKPLSNMNLDELLKSVWITEGDLNAQPIVGHKKSKMLSKLQAALEDIEATRASGRLALRAMSAFHENRSGHRCGKSAKWSSKGSKEVTSTDIVKVESINGIGSSAEGKQA